MGKDLTGMINEINDDLSREYVDDVRFVGYNEK